ncbi:tripartite motif-containing protein 3-like [Acanthaster planci]|uniref:Tripartite motif-containing protein 3-like n=1 Tax=Acanthaster planci TaxID=133434 RepID=A0A8B7YIW6_ACAPL|nr:tripartite motif-containing protein 3-like [Acanthaster planci]
MAEELQRILECPMCLELFDSSERWPKLMPCQHTFCRVCLVQLDKQGMITCPQCRHQCKSPPGGAYQLPNNFTMLALLDVHKKSAPSTKSNLTSSSEPAQEKAADESVQKAIAELAQKLQQKAGDLAGIDTKRKKVEEKFLAVKGQVDAAFESRARDLQIRKEAVIKQLAAMRKEELNLMDTQKASAYQYIQKFQKDFAVMRESILTSQQPTQDQYNQLLTMCHHYTQQIDQYALSIDENLHEVSFTDPNRTQLAVSINSYGILQATSIDKNRSKPSNAIILQLQSPPSSTATTVTGSTSPGTPDGSATPTNSATPSVFTRNSSAPEISLVSLNRSLPHVASSPDVHQQDGSPSVSRSSSRSASPQLASRNRSQTVPNMNPIAEAQNPSVNSSSTAGTPVGKDSTGSVFVLSGNPSSVGSPEGTARERSESSPATNRQTEASHTRNPFSLAGESVSNEGSLNTPPNPPESTTPARRISAPSQILSSSVPVSRRPAAGDAARPSLTKHASFDQSTPNRAKPAIPARPKLNSSTRHGSIDFSQGHTTASGDLSRSLTPIREKNMGQNRPVSLSTASNSSQQSGTATSPEGPIPPLPPRRIKTTQPNRPRSMSADSSSSLGGKSTWVRFDTIGSRSRRFGKNGAKEIAVIGSGWFGGSFFERPTGVAVLPHNLMAIVDERHHCITMVTEAGQLVKSLGSQGNGQGQFQFPKSICLNRRQQMIVSDWWNHRIQIWDMNGMFISQFGTRGLQASQLNGPLGVACDASDNIFVCDTNNHCVKVFSPEGKYLRQIGKEGQGEGNFICPSHLVVSPGGELLITDSGKHCVQMFSNHGTFLYQFGDWGTGPGQLNCPSGIMIDPTGYLFVSSSGNHRIEVYNPSGSFAVSLGTHGMEEGQFDEPIGVASTSEGQVVVCDSGNKRVQIMWP